MNKIAVAQELVRVAKLLKADTGDVAVYFNISDFIEGSEGMLTSKQTKVAEDFLREATQDAWLELDKMVKKAMHRYELGLAKEGLKIK